jgi:hypothetical protein
MTIKEFKSIIERTIGVTELRYGISEPFSWRGSYDEVAFEILDEPMSKQEVLRRVDLACTGTYDGYKGGEYRYDESTQVNFESGWGQYSDGEYCSEWIAKLENSSAYKDQETRLVTLLIK